MLLGFVSQSSRTLSLLFSNIVKVGVVKPNKLITLLVFSNLGVLFIMFAVIFPITTVTMIFTALAGFLYSINHIKKFESIFSLILSIALLLYGLSMISSNAKMFMEFPQIDSIIYLANSYSALGIVVGIFLVVLTQSYPAMILLIVTLSSTDLSWFASMNLLMGVHIGAAINTILIAVHIKGIARQVILYVVYYFISVVVLFYVIWFILEKILNLSIQTLLSDISNTPSDSTAESVIIINLIACIFISIFGKYYSKYMNFLSPEMDNEIHERPKYIDDSALYNPSMALDLARQEHERLVLRFQNYINLLILRNYEMLADEGLAFYSVQNRIHAYLDELIATNTDSNLMSDISRLKELDYTIVLIESAIMKIGEKLSHSHLSEQAWAFISKMLDEMNSLIKEFVVISRNGSAQDIDSFYEKTHNQNHITLNIQKSFLCDIDNLTHIERASLLQISNLFERFVWLLHRYSASLLKKD